MDGNINLTLDSDAFVVFKSDFQLILNSTLATMQEKSVECASIAVKFEIELANGKAPELQVQGQPLVERDIIVPAFEHKITATMQMKAERKGNLGGNGYELVFDKESGQFVMRRVRERQVSIFDSEVVDACVDEYETPDEHGCIDAPEAVALPAPEEIEEREDNEE